MIIDTSAIIAILLNEPEAPRLTAALDADPVRRVSAAALVETGIVMLSRYGEHGEREVDLFVQRAAIDVIAVSEEQAELARGAFRQYGEGRHAAGLNFGDCFSYALAAALNEPLLFVGDDFSKTDITVA
jgi:ribonuclease VapC